ncbi:glycosyl transferase family 1 [Ectopseudomonas composti]|uniref:Glycosyl transferase family 1 n=2 Tax=Ectopseudomonas composti TaxID=658457 RepID=A0ABN0SDM6_9GAMM|nr:glycosyl transferase family 1 [Pseudomonas composti]
MQVIYNGIDTEKFKPENHPRQTDECFRLLYVGSWMTRKGVDLLAPIMRELGEDFELRYTGGATATQDKPDMPKNMHDIGRLQGDAAIVSAMQDVDVLLFPSRSEGFGLVAAEAMACGLPVIAFSDTCLEEIVQDGVTGRLLPLGDVHATAEAVREIARSSTSRNVMSVAARNRAVSRFGLPAMLDAYLNAYSLTLEQRE